MVPFEYIVAIDIYRDPEMDLQIPQSHLAFRMPAGFTRRLNAMEHSEFFTRPQAPAFSSFTARIRASEKLDERYLRLMARRLSSPASRACTERYRYRKFKGISLPTNSMRPIDRRWFARFSSRVLNPKPDRLAMFLKPFLSSMDRSNRLPRPRLAGHALSSLRRHRPAPTSYSSYRSSVG